MEIKELAEDVYRTRFHGNLHRVALNLKHSPFHEEDEWRLIGGPFSYDHQRAGWRPRGSMLIPYHEFDLVEANEPIPISEFYIGPSPNQELLDRSTSFFLYSHQIRPDIHYFAIPYRTNL